jgi:16S rRNA (adenine1518-N6/adenine1519-N6)-dimethyltransferase
VVSDAVHRADPHEPAHPADESEPRRPADPFEPAQPAHASESAHAADRPERTAATATGATQPTLRRMREFDVHPDRELGQNFLVDSNILGVIGALAELGAGDVVLEVGGGVGVLSEYLAERVGHVHVVEIDERLRPALRDAVGRAGNVTVHWGDVLRVDLAGMRPEPGKVVANLPYGVATSALLRTIEELPTVELWVAMVQREVGERLAAAPGSRAYGTPSVLAQLACAVRVARAIPRAVFYPVPNVDSVLVVMRRTGPAPSGELRVLVRDAFAHRRKTLVRSLALAAAARRAGGGDTSTAAISGARAGRAPAYDGDIVRAALAELGHPADARAERLSPDDFRALADALAAP